VITKSDLSRSAIVERALDLADSGGGLDAVTIRRLGQDFGVTPMALYWHVKNKDELLDAMGDRLFETIDYRPDPGAAWHDQLRAVVRGMVDSFRRHPACLDLAYRRVFACDEGRELAEHVLRVLREAGFSRRQTADIATHSLQTALMLVASEPGAEPGFTAAEVALKLADKRAGLHDLPIDRFPYIHEMADDMLQCDDVEAYYDFNVELFVAGARATLADGQRAESLR
jgi:AcrR family transcriptional regulator